MEKTLSSIDHSQWQVSSRDKSLTLAALPDSTVANLVKRRVTLSQVTVSDQRQVSSRDKSLTPAALLDSTVADLVTRRVTLASHCFG